MPKILFATPKYANAGAFKLRRLWNDGIPFKDVNGDYYTNKTPNKTPGPVILKSKIASASLGS